MARISPTANAYAIKRCVENVQQHPEHPQDNTINLGDAILALLTQVKLLNEAVRTLDDRHVSLPVKLRREIRTWMGDD